MFGVLVIVFRVDRIAGRGGLAGKRGVTFETLARFAGSFGTPAPAIGRRGVPAVWGRSPAFSVLRNGHAPDCLHGRPGSIRHGCLLQNFLAKLVSASARTPGRGRFALAADAFAGPLAQEINPTHQASPGLALIVALVVPPCSRRLLINLRHLIFVASYASGRWPFPRISMVPIFGTLDPSTQTQCSRRFCLLFFGGREPEASSLQRSCLPFRGSCPLFPLARKNLHLKPTD